MKKLTILMIATVNSLSVSCSKYEAESSESKKEFFHNNGVFSEKVKSASFYDEVDQYPIVEVNQMDDGFAEWMEDNGQIDETNNNSDDFGQNPSPLAPSFNSDNGDYDVKRCKLDTGVLGIQYIDESGLTYSRCMPCAVYDEKIKKCIKIQVVEAPKKTKKRTPSSNSQNTLAIIGSILNGLSAIARLAQSYPSYSNSSPSSQNFASTGTGHRTTYNGVEYFVGADGTAMPTCTGMEGVGETCVDSPLVIDLKSDQGSIDGMELSSPEEGILFDISGKRNNHQKRRISWTSSERYKFLVLPDSHGRVLGIDQLFGNNTLGPDKRFAQHGFDALAKYDGKDFRGKFFRIPDLKINQDDPIFSSLRLWSDSNYDGYAQQEELISLEEANIESIDLDYDSNFYERDIYGNEAIFKSVVNFNNGKKTIIFDLWFK